LAVLVNAGCSKHLSQVPRRDRLLAQSLLLLTLMVQSFLHLFASN